MHFQELKKIIIIKAPPCYSYLLNPFLQYASDILCGELQMCTSMNTSFIQVLFLPFCAYILFSFGVVAVLSHTWVGIFIVSVCAMCIFFSVFISDSCCLLFSFCNSGSFPSSPGKRERKTSFIKHNMRCEKAPALQRACHQPHFRHLFHFFFFCIMFCFYFSLKNRSPGTRRVRLYNQRRK
ncbi:hypothetical protein, conserved [Trypanosoma brucei brucei TREU927]|uniref:Uncharacterized protein n=1 Tax=Trypanosoma brucei brucei (strain 927/4 GUTat10.1) TaxID=185431 RepID=Q382H4_TRYB2|nr:hypothetical protein, conserved [Trypanosoma brucei brucei TREU927]EAN80307.1 hypothetical protein, conserved [Trypanosoma brucei brucei TREU927]